MNSRNELSKSAVALLEDIERTKALLNDLSDKAKRQLVEIDPDLLHVLTLNFNAIKRIIGEVNPSV